MHPGCGLIAIHTLSRWETYPSPTTLLYIGCQFLFYLLQVGQKCRLNFGHDVDTFKFFTMCGLQEGYEPFCVNMTRSVTFWYTKELSIFENNEDLGGTKIDVTRMPAGADNPPSLKISHNT